MPIYFPMQVCTPTEAGLAQDHADSSGFASTLSTTTPANTADVPSVEPYIAAIDNAPVTSDEEYLQPTAQQSHLTVSCSTNYDMHHYHSLYPAQSTHLPVQVGEPAMFDIYLTLAYRFLHRRRENPIPNHFSRPYIKRYAHVEHALI